LQNFAALVNMSIVRRLDVLRDARAVVSVTVLFAAATAAAAVEAPAHSER